MRTTLACVLGIAAGALVASGCVHEVHHHHHDKHKHKAHRGGPPPWAPAHGYRHKHHGVELVFDTSLDVYVVVGHPGIYFRGDDYYCLRGGEWYVGRRYDGPWSATNLDHVPPGLRKKYAKGHPGQGKGHGKKHGHGHDD
jgi:hypothetical protein